MNAEPMAQLRLRASAFCGKVRGWLARTPAKVLVMFGLFLLAATLMALHTAFASKDATLHLKVQHSLRNADLSVWVDGDLAYSGKLKGSAKKKFGLIPDAIQGSLSEIVPLTSGAHQIRVRVVSDDGLIQDDSIAAEFAQHSQRELAITARRSSMQLAWQSSSGAAPTNSSWVSRYAGTLMLTIAGSIISALTGFALRELPAHIRSRQDIPRRNPPPPADSPRRQLLSKKVGTQATQSLEASPKSTKSSNAATGLQLFLWRKIS